MALTRSDIQTLLQQGEGSTLEYKEAPSASLAREMVAFANMAGGRILLGVRDDGTLAGLKASNRVVAQIEDVARNCDPNGSGGAAYLRAAISRTS